MMEKLWGKDHPKHPGTTFWDLFGGLLFSYFFGQDVENTKKRNTGDFLEAFF